MSLFGASLNKPATTPTGGGLFGGNTTNTNTGASTGSLFGGNANANANTGASASSLFGGNTNTNTANTGASASSLFGGNTNTNTANTGASASSLFGGNTANNTTSSLFGGNQTQSQPQAQPQQAAGSLFGSTQPASGLGNTQPASGLGQPASGLGLGASVSQQETTALPQGNTTGYFDSLLAKSKKQADGESPLEDLPSLQLGLGDLRQRLRKLGPQASDPLRHGKAHNVLAASGVDPGAAVKDLKYFNVHGAAAQRPVPGSGPATTDIDVEAYLANLQTKTTLSMIADGLDRSVRDFDNFLEDNINMEWDAQRKRIYDHFGIKTRDDTTGDGPVSSPRESQGGFGRSRRNPKGAGGARSTAGARGSVFGRSNLQKSVIGTPSKIGSHPALNASGGDQGDAPENTLNATSAAGDDRFVRDKQAKLAERVRQLNASRRDKVPYPILAELADVERRSGDRHAQHLVDAYQAVVAMVGEKADAETFAGGATAKERSLRELHMDPNDKSANSVAMRKKILSGALSFLEGKFFQQLETLVYSNQRESNLGGRPDVVSKVKAYVRLRAGRRDLVGDKTELQEIDGEYVWAHIFFLLRSGHVAEAAEYVKSRSTTFRSIDRTFGSYLLEYASSPERRLRRQLQERCNNEYSQRARNAPSGSLDPYRMACYKIVGRCEVGNRTLEGINTDIEDWIWLQFSLARENERTIEVASESFTLADLQKSMQEIGKKHFPKTPGDDAGHGQFGMYFFLQVLSGLFEQAIAYLYPFSYVDAIHFAIGLEFYGLIRPADPWTVESELLSRDTRENAQLSFGRMLGYYTRDFRAADVASAVDYLVLICLNADLDGEAGRQQAELCHMALRELVLETREFSQLIGDIRPDGQRITGLIEERSGLIGLRQEDDFVRAVTLQAARFADDNGRTTDAVLLYHLAGDYDSVVTIVSRALSEAISLEIGQDPMRLMPVKPRAAAQQQQPQQQRNSSLSLASIDDPIELARTMMTMYEQDAMFYTKIEDVNRNACHILLQMSQIKGMVEGGQWAACLDRISSLSILPLDARGDPAKIRHYASMFAGLPQPVAINVPNLLMWTITCCIRQRDLHMGGQFSGNEGTRRLMVDQLKQMSVDLTTYTSQLKYRFPPHLHEALARASAD